MSSETTAEGNFEANVGDFLEALESLETHLTALQTKFADAGPGITGHLQGIDAAAQQAAGALGSTAAAGAGTTGMMGQVKAGAMGLVSALVGVSHWAFLIPNSLGGIGNALGNLLGRIHPVGKAMVSAFSNALPGIKHALEYVSTASGVFDAIRGKLTPLGAVFTYMGARAIGASRAVAGIGAAAALATSTVIAGTRAMGAALGSMAAMATASLGTVGMAFSAIPMALPLTLAVAGLAAAFMFLKKAVQVSAGFEQTTTSFKTLVGNAEMAKKAIADLIAFSDRSGTFDKFQTTEAGRQLVAFGFAADQLLPILTDVGDLAAGMQKPLLDVANAFGYIKAGQFGNAFSSFRSLGISMQELEAKGLKFDKSGQFQGSAEQAMTAVRAVIQERFGGSMAELSKTWGGMWSQLVSQAGNAMRAIGEPLLAALKPVLGTVVKMVHDLAPVMAEVGKAMAEAFLTVGPVLMQMLKMAGSVFAELLKMVAGLSMAVTALAKAMGFKVPPVPGTQPARTDRARPMAKGDEHVTQKEAQVGRLRERGGGGAFHIGLGKAGADPVLDENRRQTRLLEQLVSQGRNGGGGVSLRLPTPVEV